jgi:hypothetical protein
MSRVHFPIFLFTLTVLAGCSGHSPTSSPTDTATETATSTGPTALTAVPPLSMPTGLQASYVFGPPWPTFRPVNFTITVNSATDFLYTFRYKDCAACDGDIQYRMAPDGSWAHAEFACLLPFFDARGVNRCLDYIGGWSNQDGLRGPFFGASLVAGLPLESDGTVSRSFSFGTTTLTARFRVDPIGLDRIQIAAVDAQTRAFPLHNGFEIEPADCTVFNGRVTLNVTLGLPVECQIIDETNLDNQKAFRYTLSWTNAKPGASGFTPTDLPTAATYQPDGVRFPPRDGDDNMHFGLYEAMDYAASKDARVKAFLERPDSALGNSLEYWQGGTQTGACSMACLRTDNFIWLVSLRSGTEDLRFNVTKQITSPSGLSMLSLGEVRNNPSSAPFATFPGQFAHPLGWYWKQGETSTNVRPSGLQYVATARGSPANIEPFVSVQFHGPESGYIPTIWFRADGTVQLWEAKGATT